MTMNAPTDKMPQLAGTAPAAPERGFKRLAIGAAVLVLVGAGVASLPAWRHAGSEATEDAYVEGNVVQVTPQVIGTVTRIAADNTDFVRQGETLVQLNELDAKLALDRAEAQLSKAVRQVRGQFSSVLQARA